MTFWYGGGWPFREAVLMRIGMMTFSGVLIWAAYARAIRQVIRL